jgi:uncharacterized protein YqjF (DUF2071 family)
VQPKAAMNTLLPLPLPARPTARPVHPDTGLLSAMARHRMLANRGEPLLTADWDRALMVHYEVDPAALRPFVPFPLDVRDGRAYVTLLAFTLRDMKPRRGGKLTEWLFRPIATHGFLNVRTYVRVGNETGIYFLTEYLPNALSLRLGPPLFGLPYRPGKLEYHHRWEDATLSGRVADTETDTAFSYTATLPLPVSFDVSPAGALSEWLMERYTAFTAIGRHRRFFRVWHEPWLHTPVKITVSDDSLLRARWPWFGKARLIGASFSPGLRKVWMGRPHRLPARGA